MRYINELTKFLPIKYTNREVKLLSVDYIQEYIDILRSENFNMYLDFNFSRDISVDKLQVILYNICVEYVLKLETTMPARLILLNENNKVIGGCTLFETDSIEDVELSYFIIEEYQHRNETYTMVKNVLNIICNSGIPYKNILLHIQSSNKASIKLAERLGFEYESSVQGKYDTNITMKLHKEKDSL